MSREWETSDKAHPAIIGALAALAAAISLLRAVAYNGKSVAFTPHPETDDPRSVSEKFRDLRSSRLHQQVQRYRAKDYRND